MAKKRARAVSIDEGANTDAKRHQGEPSTDMQAPTPPNNDLDAESLAAALIGTGDEALIVAALALLADGDSDSDAEIQRGSEQQDGLDEDAFEGAIDGTGDDFNDTLDNQNHNLEPDHLRGPNDMPGILRALWSEDKDTTARGSPNIGSARAKRPISPDKKVDKLPDISDRLENRTIRLEQALQDMARTQEQHFQAIMKQIQTTFDSLNKRITALEQRDDARVNLRADDAHFHESQPVAASSVAQRPPPNAAPFEATQ